MDDTTLSVNPSSPGQGALAIETRRKDTELNDLLKRINFSQEFSNVDQERNILKNYGGGCHQKIGVSYISHFGNNCFQKGEDENGKHFMKKISKHKLNYYLQYQRNISRKFTIL